MVRCRGRTPGAFAAALPLGALDVARWRALVRVAQERGTGELRLTPWRGVVLPGVEAAAEEELARHGLVTRPDSVWPLVSACTGLPGCARAHRDVRADATAAMAGTAPEGVAELPSPRPGLPVHWAGCARRCGRPRGRRVDVVAGPGGYHTTVAE